MNADTKKWVQIMIGKDPIRIKKKQTKKPTLTILVQIALMHPTWGIFQSKEVTG